MGVYNAHRVFFVYSDDIALLVLKLLNSSTPSEEDRDAIDDIIETVQLYNDSHSNH